MGMFDSFIAEDGTEWQVKFFDCNLDEWHVGDRFETEGPQSFQIEAIGGRRNGGVSRWSLVTVRDGVVEACDVPRDESLPLFGYSSGVTPGARR
jgi:hypothetical protein